MSIIGSNILAGASGSGVSAYEIEQSLRFNSADSASLSRTPGSAGNRRTWTWSAWVKRSELGAWQTLFSAGNSSPSQRGGIRFSSGDQLNVEEDSGGYALTSTQLFRDVSAWYHLVIAFDSTQATSTNRIKAYVNGAQIAAFSTASYPSQNFDSIINTTDPHRIGELSYAGNIYEFGGYLAEVNFIDGSALDHEDFGELDDNGVWRPIQYAGSYTGNSFYLKFASGDGTDSSGLSNTWTANNFTTSGTGTDVMNDTPTTNWCTLNPLETGLTLSNGNLDYTYTAANRSARGTIGMSSGKFRWEVKVNGNGNSYDKYAGIIKANNDSDNYDKNANEVRYNADAWGISSLYGGSTAGRPIHDNTAGSTIGWTWTAGDILGIYFDATNGTLKANQNGGTLATLYTGLDTTATWLPLFSDGSVASSTDIVNFGQRAFEYSDAESGYSALNTSNLPAPEIADGSEYFNTVLWTGDGVSGRAITGVGFQPDFLWIKGRNISVSHYLQNSVTGATNYMFSDDTIYERNIDDSVDSFDTDGFTVGNDGGTNGSGGTYVGWNWLAGNGTSSNTDGSITSTVSANPTAGFSIVSYTGTGSAATVGHGLGVAPNLIIVKSRNYSPSSNWKTYWSVLGDKYIDLNDYRIAYDAGANIWNDTAPTSTVFSIGTDSDTNYSSSTTYIAYCFAEVEGYSKFGTYERNGSSDGPYVHLGFTPALILIKEYAAGTEGWALYDNKRLGYNPNDYPLFPNTAQSESYISSTYANEIDFLSNGFKLRTSDSRYNSSLSSYRYLYAAWAVNPFGGSGVSPATAR